MPHSQHNTCNTHIIQSFTVWNGHDWERYVDGRQLPCAYQPSTLSIPPSGWRCVRVCVCVRVWVCVRVYVCVCVCAAATPTHIQIQTHTGILDGVLVGDSGLCCCGLWACVQWLPTVGSGQSIVRAVNVDAHCSGPVGLWWQKSGWPTEESLLRGSESRVPQPFETVQVWVCPINPRREYPPPPPPLQKKKIPPRNN